MKLRIATVSATLALAATATQATLSPYSNDGVALVYSSVSDVTWTRDANLFRTLAAADSALVANIIELTPTYNDDHFGVVTLSAAQFNPSAGWMSWWGARAFANYLNHMGYAGSTQWALPTVAGNEMQELFYAELGGTAGQPRPDTDFFVNEPEWTHWLHDQVTGAPQYAWNFGYYGSQPVEYKYQSYAAWFITPGMVAAVPETASSSLLLAGLGTLGLLAWRRQRTVRTGAPLAA